MNSSNDDETIRAQLKDTSAYGDLLNAVDAPLLIVLEGIQPGRIILIKETEFTLGREAHNHFVLQTPKVSKLHARITKQNEQYFIEDHHSTNGTMVNNTRLEPGKRYLLCHGDIILLPDHLLLFRHEQTLAEVETFADLQFDKEQIRSDVDRLFQAAPNFIPKHTGGTNLTHAEGQG